MYWKNIRLELARTQEFPEGSASRAYLLRLPLDDRGLIDERAVRADPGHATVRRFWPSEPDMIGYVIRKPGGWAFSYESGEADDEGIFHLESSAEARRVHHRQRAGRAAPALQDREPQATRLTARACRAKWRFQLRLRCAPQYPSQTKMASRRARRTCGR